MFVCRRDRGTNHWMFTIHGLYCGWIPDNVGIEAFEGGWHLEYRRAGGDFVVVN